MKKGYRTMALIAALFVITGCNNNGGAPGSKSNDAENKPASVAKTKNIVFFGNSLTAGYGLSPTEAFPAIIQNKIDSLGFPYKVINAGVSGETSSGGNGRIDWILRQPLHVFVLELGANDGLRGIPLSETKKSLQSIVDKVKAKYPEAKLVLAGMQIPPNMGQSYTTEFRDLYPELAEKNGMTLIPFLLDGVGGELKLNQQDGIHPTAEGHHKVAENVWRVLEGVM
jgi:acyl-CoA thioesterase-1